MKKIKYTNWWAFEKKEQSIESALAKMDLYNKTRFGRRKVIDENLLLEAAILAHEKSQIYYVIIYENEKPYCHLEINKGFYRVNFLDQYYRTYMAYTFLGKDDIAEWRKSYDNRLFLETIVFWEFEGNTDKMVKITDYIFKPDGSFHITERDLITNEQIDSEAKNKIDVTANWEEYPEFGKYDSLIQKDRNVISI